MLSLCADVLTLPDMFDGKGAFRAYNPGLFLLHSKLFATLRVSNFMTKRDVSLHGEKPDTYTSWIAIIDILTGRFAEVKSVEPCYDELSLADASFDARGHEGLQGAGQR